MDTHRMAGMVWHGLWDTMPAFFMLCCCAVCTSVPILCTVCLVWGVWQDSETLGAFLFCFGRKGGLVYLGLLGNWDGWWDKWCLLINWIIIG